MRTNLIIATACAAGGLAFAVATRSSADSAKNTEQPAAAGEMQLPPGWTREDMQAMMAAGTPGKMHERLLQDVGTWTSKS